MANSRTKPQNRNKKIIYDVLKKKYTDISTWESTLKLHRAQRLLKNKDNSQT